MDNKNNKTNLDELAQMIANGFVAVDKRFDSVDKRFEDIEQRMATKEDLNGAEQRLEKRLIKLEATVEEIRDNLSTLEKGEILDLQQRMQAAEKSIRVLEKKAA